MKNVVKMLMLFCLAASAVATAGTVDNISVDKIEVYTEKSKIPDLGTGGSSIPAGVKVVVLRTSNPTYSGWKFVAYGDSINETLSLWLSAKAMGKNMSCVWEDRGNYWVQCVGVAF